MRGMARQELLVVVCNTVLVLAILCVTVGGLIESRRFVGQLSPYGFTPNPFWQDLLWIARLKWFDLVCACALIWGGVSQIRGSRWAAVLNPLSYAAQVAIIFWYAIQPGRGGEFILPLALAEAVVFGFAPTLGLFLYRREISHFVRKKKQERPDLGGSQ